MIRASVHGAEPQEPMPQSIVWSEDFMVGEARIDPDPHAKI